MRALQNRSRKGTLDELDRIAGVLISMAKGKNVNAIRELVDRLDGKSVQAISGDPENPLLFKDLSKVPMEELEKLVRGGE